MHGLFLHQEYTYGACYWYSGETWSVALEDSLRYEKFQLDKKRGLRRVCLKLIYFLCICSVFFFSSLGERLNVSFFFILRGKKETIILKNYL